MSGTDVPSKLAVYDTIERIYADDRWPTSGSGRQLRELAVTITWATAHQPKGKRAAWVCQAMGLHQVAFRGLIREDCPRYEPDSLWSRAGCEAPMVRRNGVCGRNASVTFRVTDWATGQWRLASWCSRHRAECNAARVAEQARQKSGSIPEPTPNTGGLLPIYVRWNWPEAYAWADPRWKPPRLGIRRDDWPVLDRVAGLEPPKLKLIPGDGHEGPSAAPGIQLLDGQRPSLQIVAEVPSAL